MFFKRLFEKVFGCELFFVKLGKLENLMLKFIKLLRILLVDVMDVVIGN